VSARKAWCATSGIALRTDRKSHITAEVAENAEGFRAPYSSRRKAHEVLGTASGRICFPR